MATAPNQQKGYDYMWLYHCFIASNKDVLSGYIKSYSNIINRILRRRDSLSLPFARCCRPFRPISKPNTCIVVAWMDHHYLHLIFKISALAQVNPCSTFFARIVLFSVACRFWPFQVNWIFIILRFVTKQRQPIGARATSEMQHGNFMLIALTNGMWSPIRKLSINFIPCWSTPFAQDRSNMNI